MAEGAGGDLGSELSNYPPLFNSPFSFTMTISKARQILGHVALDLTDQEVEAIIVTLTELARELLDSHSETTLP